MKYKSFQNIQRGKNQEMMAFKSDFDQEHSLAQAVGCGYSDKILAFQLLEAANLSSNDEKFVFMAIYFNKGNLTDQMEVSVKKFQGRALVSEEKEGIKFDAALVAKIKVVWLEQGWKKPEKSKRQSQRTEIF